MTEHSINIIGYGKVGRALSIAFRAEGYRNIKIHKKGEKIQLVARINFITVPDNAIEEIGLNIATGFKNLSDKFFFHCSGIHPASILSPIAEKKGIIGSFHPMMAINKGTNSFQNIFFDLEGNNQAIKKMKELADLLGAMSFEVSKTEKELLHISSVLASNYLVTLASLALKISETSNIPERTLLNSLLPLMSSVLKNLESKKPSEALTGPISRGDIETIEKHLEILNDDKQILKVYKQLGLHTLELISGNLKNEIVKQKLYNLLK